MGYFCSICEESSSVETERVRKGRTSREQEGSAVTVSVEPVTFGFSNIHLQQSWVPTGTVETDGVTASVQTELRKDAAVQAPQRGTARASRFTRKASDETAATPSSVDERSGDVARRRCQ